MDLRSHRSRSRLLLGVSLVVLVALMLGGCSAMPDMSGLPVIGTLFGPAEPPTPTPAPTPTNTPEPTATPKPGETPIPATATPVPTPQVTIPNGFTPVKDDTLGYSLAVPRGWTALDLRGAQFQNMANTFGMGAQMGPLNDFLASDAGKALGVVYITDLMAALSGGLHTLLNVSVIDAPGLTPASAVTWLQGVIDANASALGGAKIENLSECTVNGMPAVCGTATANLASYGINSELFAKVTAIIANDKIYVLTLATTTNNRPTKEPVFDQIIGTFRPE